MSPSRTTERAMPSGPGPSRPARRGGRDARGGPYSGRAATPPGSGHLDGPEEEIGRPEAASASAPTDPRLIASLDDGLARLAISLSATTRDGLLRYLALLARWNRVYNLSAIRDPEQMVTSHLLDSLAVLPVLRQAVSPSDSRPVSLIDVGAGAGLPGIPLALAWPALRITLAEPVGKKAAFLRQCSAELGLAQRVQVHAARVETLASSSLPADLIICRAFASLRDYTRAIAHLVAPQTQVWAMKGRAPTEELADLPTEWRLADLQPIEVPGLEAQRHLLRLESVAARREELPS